MQVTETQFKKLLVSAKSAIKAGNWNCSFFDHDKISIAKHANSNAAWEAYTSKNCHDIVKQCQEHFMRAGQMVKSSVS